MSPPRHDVLYVADLAADRPAASRIAEELARLVRHGRRVALRPVSWPPASPLAPVARELLARREVTLVLPGEAADGALLIVDAANLTRPGTAPGTVLAGVGADLAVIVTGPELVTRPAAAEARAVLAAAGIAVRELVTDGSGRPERWPAVTAVVPARPRQSGDVLVGIVVPARPDRRLRLVRALRDLPAGVVPVVLGGRAPGGWQRADLPSAAERVAAVDALVVPRGHAGLRELAVAGGRPVLDADRVRCGTDLAGLAPVTPPGEDTSVRLLDLVDGLLAEVTSTAVQLPGSATTTRPAGTTVLYVSSNGAGMGHLTRLMAMSRRADPRVRPLFVSMSSAVPVVAAEGLPYEYVPSRGDLGIGRRRWNVSFAERFAAILRRERPAAIVFDGTFPYDGLFVAREALPGVRLVWSRRGMWREGLGVPALSRSSRFDLVVEPGEYASSLDRGLTGKRDDVTRVDPVTLLDASEQLSRTEAAEVLGIDPARPAALLTLGAGNINDITSDLGLLVNGLLEVPDLQVVVTRPVIAGEGGPAHERVHGVSTYPVSRCFSAVDFAVAASGYNAFHELVSFGVPTAFVPNTSTALDDQAARARWAQEAGVGLLLSTVSPKGVARVAQSFFDGARRAPYVEACRAVARPNGAAAAQRAVEELVGITAPAVASSAAGAA